MDVPQTDDLVPSVTVCERLAIDRSTLSRWIAAGKITPAMQLPGKTGAYLFNEAEVERLAGDKGQVAS